MVGVIRSLQSHKVHLLVTRFAYWIIIFSFANLVHFTCIITELSKYLHKHINAFSSVAVREMSPRVSRKSGNRICDRCYVPFPLLFISAIQFFLLKFWHVSFRYIVSLCFVLVIFVFLFVCLFNFVLSLVICFALFHLFRFFSPFFYFIIYPSSSHPSSIEIYVLKYIIIFIITIIILLSPLSV